MSDAGGKLLHYIGVSCEIPTRNQLTFSLLQSSGLEAAEFFTQADSWDPAEVESFLESVPPWCNSPLVPVNKWPIGSKFVPLIPSEEEEESREESNDADSGKDEEELEEKSVDVIKGRTASPVLDDLPVLEQLSAISTKLLDGKTAGEITGAFCKDCSQYRCIIFVCFLRPGSLACLWYYCLISGRSVALKPLLCFWT